MEVSRTDVRDHLNKLRIDKSQRPSVAQPAARSAPRRMWPLILTVFLVAGGVGYAMRERIADVVGSRFGAAPEVRLIPVSARTGTAPPALHTAVGRIVSDHRVKVATKVSGQIVGLFFEQGDAVDQGQVIAKIEDVFYIARRDNAAANLARSKARLAFAEQNFQRISGLHQSDDAPEIEFNNAKAEFDAARAQVDADKAALTESQWRADWCEVTAPISGTVLERNVEVGDFVAAEGGFGGMANSQFATIADMTKLRVEVDVSEMDITKIRREMPCVIIPDAYKDRKYHGHVMWLDPLANYSKGSVQVKVRIENPDDYLRVEGSARVDFLAEEPDVSDEGKSTIWLPKSAVLIESPPSGGVVMTYDDERLERQTVTVGRQDDRLAEITAGLTPGMRVADEPGKYQDGQRVKLPGA